jgi:hypothetical protein
MSIPKKSSRLAWLTAKLSNRRSPTTNLLRHMRRLGPRSNMNLSVFRKLILMPDPVMIERTKEIITIYEIKDVGEKQYILRKSRHCEKNDSYK